MDDIQQIHYTYFQLLQKQQFDPKELDYSILEHHLPTLETIAKVGNSAISVFDLHRIEHVFYSSSYLSFLGFEGKFSQTEQELLNQRIHPEDILELTKNGITLLKLFYEFSREEKQNYKLINEFRVLNNENNYYKVIEQHQVLELDKKGNLWLALSILDVSPNQDENEGFKSQLLNIKTGETIPFHTSAPQSENKAVTPALTKRESEILQMVKNGFLSKEISHKLGISIHTVNTHRQRLLEKLDANNSMEAIHFASQYGLV